jgi:hypothetical protein
MAEDQYKSFMDRILFSPRALYHPDTSWMTKYQYLGQTLGWTFAPVYVGQRTNSPVLAPDQGTADGQSAASLKAQAGFLTKAVIYLDIEQGGLLPQPMVDYFTAWVAAVIGQGYSAVVYCSYNQTASQLSNEQGPSVWASQLNSYSCANDGTNPYPTPDPSGSGVDFAVSWQLIQNCAIVVNGVQYSVDFRSSKMSDPSTLNS